MANTAITRLRKLKARIHRAEGQLESWREERNQLLVQAMEEGATEREAAEASGVSAAYTHRVKRFKGSPISGTEMNKRRQQAA